MLSLISGCRAGGGASGQAETSQRPGASERAGAPLPATTCDDEAGDPVDPERTSPGVMDGQIVPRRAVDACRKAVDAAKAARSADAARLTFQLGRAHAAARHLDEAEAAFADAAKAGHCAAFYHWAWFAEEQRDWNTARARYQHAIGCGYPRAAAAHARITWNPTGFNRPDILDRLTSHSEPDIAALNVPLRPAIAAYLGGFHDQWARLAPPECAGSRAYAVGGVKTGLDAAIGGDPRVPGERELNRLLVQVIPFFDPRYGNEGWERYKALLDESGRIDAVRFAERHGCDATGPVTSALLDGLALFARRPLPALEIVKSLYAKPEQRLAVVESLKETGLLDGLLGAPASPASSTSPDVRAPKE